MVGVEWDVRPGLGSICSGENLKEISESVKGPEILEELNNH